MRMEAQPSSAPPAPWQELYTGCAAAIRMSEAIGGRLRGGAVASEFVPLVRQQSELVRQLHARIRELGQKPRHPQDRTCRERLVDQLRRLLDLEQGNHQLLARRGVRLRDLRPGRRPPVSPRSL
jgi:hypothetical protein